MNKYNEADVTSTKTINNSLLAREKHPNILPSLKNEIINISI